METMTRLFIFISFLLNFSCSARRTYLVHMKLHHKPEKHAKAADWYSDHYLSHTSSKKLDSLLYTYSSAYHGYAAVLHPEEVSAIRRSDAVAGVYEDRAYKIQTTRTPEFLNLEGVSEFLARHRLPDIQSLTNNVIVGVIDTGIWPEDKSFSGFGLPPVPKRWQGKCASAADFDPKISCNNKLIGAQVFYQGYESGTNTTVPHSPRDYEGHGTHTSSTAVGATVRNAGLFGYASGTARGMATHARLSIYKVCFDQGCFSSDIMAAMDQAIYDGVDIMSLSLGGDYASPYDQDPIAVGAFAATEYGIVVSCSAGNAGPSLETVSNVAPWLISVGAGTLDRTFPAYLTLGNGNIYVGVSLYSGKGMGDKLVSLVHFTGVNSSLCLDGYLDPPAVRGKVVLCDRGVNARVAKGFVVKKAGGVAMILANKAADGEDIEADAHILPALAIGDVDGAAVRAYAKTSNPTAVLRFGSTKLNVKPAPVLAAFSSRGPNTVTPQILKPDVIGPGVNVLAAWSTAMGPTGQPGDTRRTPFNIISGTSMACPHISGVSALLKGIHPDWSPSAIKSALITTAYIIDNTNSPIRDEIDSSIATPFGIGAGHIDPTKAVSPGLVYDATTDDFIAFLCWSNYSDDTVSAIAGVNVTCPSEKLDPGQLNYPSFSVVFNNTRRVSYTRVVTSVAHTPSVYEVSITTPAEVKMSVNPRRLVFTKKWQKMKYSATFELKNGATRGSVNQTYAFGAISWISDRNQVTSPVTFTWF